MSGTTSSDRPELEALFLAARHVESGFLRERAQNSRLRAEAEAQQTRHAAQLAQAQQHLQNLTSRDEELRKHLARAQNQLRSYAARCAQLEQSNQKLSEETKNYARQTDLDLTTARTSFQHVKQKNQELRDTLEKLRPELTRAREELERAQSEVLEREHRHQASILNYQGRDRLHGDALNGLKDQLKRVQADLHQAKSRWLETEKLRQETEQFRQEAERNLRHQGPAMQKIKDLAEANHSLEQRLTVERRQREQADRGLNAERQEKESLRSALRATEERLAYTEAQLSQASAEAALLRATRKPNSMHLVSSQTSPSSPRPIDIETLERLAMPGYPSAN